MRLVFSLLLLLGASLAFSDSLLSSVWESEQYFLSYPRQRPLMEQFAVQVKRNPSPVQIAQNRSIRIALLLPFSADVGYWERSLFVFKQRMKELRIDYRLDLYHLPVPGDPLRSLEQYEKALATEPDYVVTSLNNVVQRKMIEQILAKKESKIILHSFTHPIRSWSSSPPLMYTGADQRQAIQSLADYLYKHYDAPFKWAAVMLPPGYDGQFRCDHFLDTMHQMAMSPEQVMFTNGSAADAESAATRLLQRHQLDFIFSCSADISMGVQKAIRNTDSLGSVTTNGWGGNHDEFKQLHEGMLLATLLPIEDDIAVSIAESIKADMEDAAAPRLFLAGMALLTQESSRYDIDQLKNQAFRYSNQLWTE